MTTGQSSYWLVKEPKKVTKMDMLQTKVDTLYKSLIN